MVNLQITTRGPDNEIIRESDIFLFNNQYRTEASENRKRNLARTLWIPRK